MPRRSRERDRRGSVHEAVAFPQRVRGGGAGGELADDQVFEDGRVVLPELSRLLLVPHEELHAVPRCAQRAHGVGPDEAGAAGHEDAHASPSRSGRDPTTSEAISSASCKVDAGWKPRRRTARVSPPTTMTRPSHWRAWDPQYHM